MELPTPKHEKVGDGWGVFCWPEFRAFLKRAEVSDKKLKTFKLSLLLDKMGLVEVSYGDSYQTDYKVLETSFEIYRWPEFQALAKRMGIPLDMWIVDLVIEEISEGVFPKFTMRAACSDNALTPEPDAVKE